jgi:serine/threonine protein phosphatase PrpC
MVSRSLGDHDLKKCDNHTHTRARARCLHCAVCRYVIAEPHYRRETLDAQCEFLILACDGIWDVADDQAAGAC